MLMQIDLGRIGRGDGPGDRVTHDALAQPLALDRRDQLRVGHPGNVLLGMKHDGGRDDGAGQAAASHLVDAGHVHEPHAAQRVLQRAHGRNANHIRWKSQGSTLNCQL